MTVNSRVRTHCPICKDSPTIYIDPSIVSRLAKIKGAFNEDGFLIIACENCHPKSKMGETLHDWERRKNSA